MPAQNIVKELKQIYSNLYLRAKHGQTWTFYFEIQILQKICNSTMKAMILIIGWLKGVI